MPRVFFAFCVTLIVGLLARSFAPHASWAWGAASFIIAWIAYDPRTAFTPFLTAWQNVRQKRANEKGESELKKRKSDYPAWARAYDRWTFWLCMSACTMIVSVIWVALISATLYSGSLGHTMRSIPEWRQAYVLLRVAFYGMGYVPLGLVALFFVIFGLYASSSMKWCEQAEKLGEERVAGDTRTGKVLAVAILPPVLPFTLLVGVGFVLYFAVRALWVCVTDFVPALFHTYLTLADRHERTVFAVSVALGTTVGYYLDPFGHRLWSLLAGAAIAALFSVPVAVPQWRKRLIELTDDY